ncbi:MAG: hypothetical protein KAT40_00555 [Bacteroidales bacterium]|nr:hypothetical protein [Bacteroidales bacterium]
MKILSGLEQMMATYRLQMMVVKTGRMLQTTFQIYLSAHGVHLLNPPGLKKELLM